MTDYIDEELDAKQADAVKQINAPPQGREGLERQWGQVWDTEELRRDFHVISFSAPFILVERHADGQQGGLTFQHSPRYYFCFTPLDDEVSP
jgi:hypothetical protein